MVVSPETGGRQLRENRLGNGMAEAAGLLMSQDHQYVHDDFCSSGQNHEGGGNLRRHALGAAAGVIDKGPVRFGVGQQRFVAGTVDAIATQRSYPAHRGHPGAHHDFVVRAGRLMIGDAVPGMTQPLPSAV